MQQGMEVDTTYQGDNLIIYVKGRIDTQTAPELQQYIDEYLDSDGKKMILDFDEVDYLSSAGLRTILYAQKRINELGEEGSMKIVNVNDMVMDIFETTGFTDFISLTEKNE